MRKLIYLLFAVTILTACEDAAFKNLDDGIYANLETDKGNLIMELYADKVPLTVANFITLAEGTNPKVADSLKGKYFDGLTFHRLVKDFIVQGGDPLANGRGGPGYTFYDEFNPTLKHNEKGIVSMANPGYNSNGSQFFITYKSTPWLDAYDQTGQLKDCSNPRVGCHAVFGKVVSDLSVLDSLAQKDVIKKVTIVRKGAVAKGFDALKVFEEEFAKGPEKEKARIAAKEKREIARLEKFAKDKEVFYKKMDVEKAKKQTSGLQILTFKTGKGKKFNPEIITSINYTIYLADGTQIQSTKGADPFKFTFSKRPLITGVKEAISKMREGGKVRLFIPYYLGYGEAGGGPFPAKADIVFDLELLKVGE